MIGFAVVGYVEGNPKPVSIMLNLANLAQAKSYADEQVARALKVKSHIEARQRRSHKFKHTFRIPLVPYYSVGDETGAVLYRTSNAPSAFEVIE